MEGEQLTNKAVVLKNYGTTAQVCIIKEGECEHCTSIFCGINKNTDDVMTVMNKISAKPGDHVLISVEGKLLFQASIVLYLIPLILLISSIFIGMSLFDGIYLKEAYSFVLSIGVLALYYGIIYIVRDTSLIKTAIPEIIEIQK
jgi:positive regulator of sigma E activity